jgi:Protein of unknown function (DUF962)
MLFSRLKEQYEIDLQVYQMGHRNLFNRILHYIFIPIEIGTCSILMHRCLLSWTTTRDARSTHSRSFRGFQRLSLWIRYLFVPIIHVAVGAVSFYVSSSPHDFGIGLLAWLYHITVACLLLLQDDLMARNKCLCSSSNVFWMWFLSFLVQIVVGHYLLEGNAPTFQEPPLGAPSGVSAQAICSSVLLAWKS